MDSRLGDGLTVGRLSVDMVDFGVSINYWDVSRDIRDFELATTEEEVLRQDIVYRLPREAHIIDRELFLTSKEP